MAEIDLTSDPDPSKGNWIATELNGDAGTVTYLVPNRFAAYVRIFHPVEKKDGTLISWADVSAVTRKRMHSTIQWNTLVGARSDSGGQPKWLGYSPEPGDLVPTVFDRLCDLLTCYTNDADHCFFGLWTGWSWDIFRSVPNESGSAGAQRGVARSVDEMEAPRLKLPGREYVLLAGPLSAASQIREREDEIGSGLAPTSPNLMWPADHAWFLATEVDFDSTLVGGSADLIEAILAHEGIEAWPIGPHDSLAVEGDVDEVNP